MVNDMNFLLIRDKAGLGDLACSLKAIELLKLKYPYASITMVCRYPALLQNHPAIDFLFDINNTPANLMEYQSLIHINLSFKDDFTKSLQENFIDVVNSVLEKNGLNKIVWDGKPQKLWVSETDKQWAEQVVDKSSCGKIPIGVFLKSAQEFRTWHGMLSLVNMLMETGRFAVYVFDSEESIDGAFNVLGRELNDIVALVSQMRLVISPDSAGIHIAGGLGVPILGIFGATNPKMRLDMYKNSAHIPVDCKYHPCWFTHKCSKNRCLTELQPEKVFSKVLSLFPITVNKTRYEFKLWNMPNREAESNETKLAIFRMRGIGDVGMSWFAVEELKKRENVHVTYYTNPTSAALFCGQEGLVDKVEIIDYKHHALDQEVDIPVDVSGYDGVYNLMNKVDFGEITRKQLRVVNFADLLGVKIVDFAVRKLMVNDWEQEWVNKITHGNRYVVCQLDSEGVPRRWHIQHWQEFLWKAYKLWKCDMLFVLLGARVFDKIVIPPNTLNITGVTVIRQYIPLIVLSDILIGTDSSGIHIAARSDKKTKIIFLQGSTGDIDGKPAHTSHYDNNCIYYLNANLHCSPCWDCMPGRCRKQWNFPKCLYGIKPKHVLKVLEGVI